MRIHYTGLGCVTEERHLSNVAHAWSLDPKRVEPWGSGALAICGGGPSLARNLDKLKDYPEVWGINSTAKWLCERGIKATMFSVDPKFQSTRGIRRAVLASCTHPKVLKNMKGRDFRVFAMSPGEGEPWAAFAGPTSACRAPFVAARAGFTQFDFYGCEGSYEEKISYSDGRTVDTPNKLVVKAGGKLYVSEPEFMMQCEFLAKFILEFPRHAKNYSHGLLQAMIDYPDTWEVVAVSAGVAESMGLDVGDLPAFQGKEMSDAAVAC